MGFSDDQLSDDGFLGGRLTVLQPREGYRAATDPVFLAAAVPAQPGESVLELGCGAGVASLCLAARVHGLHLTGLELQEDYAGLALRNAARNGIALQVVQGDVAAMPAELRGESFDHVITNPPYYGFAGGSAAQDAGREIALREVLPLRDWLSAGLRRLRPGGWMTVIQAADRLGDVLAGLNGPTGAIHVLPLTPRIGRPARRVIVQARKGARGPLVLLPPLVVHAGAHHPGDAENFSAIARSVLREGASLQLRP